jgi:beta-glucosidase
LVGIGFCKDYKYPFEDPDLSIEERVEDLVSRLTLEEKMLQLRYDAPAVERLGIPEYNWWNECLHGVARNGRATVFPQAIGMAATFDLDLMGRIGSAIGDEGRAKYNVCVEHGYRGRYQGLTFWTPNINIFRDPRWGRGQETYGEDPYLTSRMAVAFVKGLQGNHPKYLKAAGCAKHYAVHSGPEGLRHEFDAVVSKKDLWETYLPAFEALVTEANVQGVMGAYNRTNGEACCAHPYLMVDVLREKWQFDGYYTSDCWAIHDFYRGHKIVDTAEEAVALALRAGCNLNCGDAYHKMPEALKAGLITEEDIDRNLKELLPTRFRLGLFDPESKVPFSSIPPEVINCEKHQKLAYETAVKSIVLLKNNDEVLPLKRDVGSVYVCGPMAAHVQALLANYYGVNENLETILEGITGKVSPHTSVKYRQGAMLNHENLNPIDWYSGVASESDVTIACVGISQLMEGEEGEAIASPTKGDRFDLDLPKNQMEFLKKIRANAKKLVVVLTGGSAITCPKVYEMADALVFVWYPGQKGGQAVADVLFGEESPSGRLPLTFPKRLEDLPPYEDYDMKGRTYRYMEKEPLFPFGFGLSYTTFDYSGLKVNRKEINAGDCVEAELTVSNTGKREVEEVVQLYITDMQTLEQNPFYSLKGFKRISLKPGREKKVSFEITPAMMQVVNEKGERVIEKGEFKVTIGGACPSDRSIFLGGANPVSTFFLVK